MGGEGKEGVVLPIFSLSDAKNELSIQLGEEKEGWGLGEVKQQVYHASLTWLMRAAAESQDSSGGVSTVYRTRWGWTCTHAHTGTSSFSFVCFLSLAESSGLQSGVDGRTDGWWLPPPKVELPRLRDAEPTEGGDAATKGSLLSCFCSLR